MRVKKVLHALQELREGKLNDGRFCVRMEGKGERWKAVSQLFDLTCKRLGLRIMDERDAGKEIGDNTPETTTFRRPGETGCLFAHLRLTNDD